MTRATEHFGRPAGATAVDPHTLAHPQFRAAWSTCERTGPAFQVARPAPWWRSPLARLVIEGLALVGFFGVLFVGYACAHG